MKKRLLAWVLSFALALSLLPVGVLAAGSTVASGTCGDNLTWVLDSEGTLTISGNGEMPGYNSWVTGPPPWENVKNSIKKIEIKNGITNIGSGEFVALENLEEIIVPESVVEIGETAFASCSKLDEISLPNSVKKIGDSAFLGCSSLSSITLPESLTEIGSSAFESCIALSTIDLPSGLSSIEPGTFYQCSNLSRVNIPEGVTDIGNDAFNYCTSLVNIVIPDSVTSIGDFAFQSCTSLESISLPEEVSYLGASMFFRCARLESLVVPDGVKTIGSDMFRSCISLDNITIPSSVTHIESGAFYSCENLKNVYYNGTEDQWNEIAVGDLNDSLLSANIHYLSTKPEGPLKAQLSYELLSEENDQYTYEITIALQNTGEETLRGVSLELYLDDALQLSESQEGTVTLGDIEGGESKSATWTVSAAYPEENTSWLYGVTIQTNEETAELWQESYIYAEAKTDYDNSIIFGEDQWRFSNSASNFSPNGTEDYYLTESDLSTLLANVSNIEKEAILMVKSRDWGGSCYGMSATVILAKNGIIDPSLLQVVGSSGAENIYSIKKQGNNDFIESFINFYHLQQSTFGVINARDLFDQKATKEQLEIIEEKASKVKTGGSPFLLDLWTDTAGGHSVVVYGVEHKGNGWFSGLGWEDGYDSRILIYDCNHPSSKTYLYYDIEDERWVYPTDEAYTRLGGAIDDINILDCVNQQNESINRTARLHFENSLANYRLSVDGTSIPVSAATDLREQGIVARGDLTTNTGEAGGFYLTLPSMEKSYTISAEGNSACDVDITYENINLSAVSEESDAVTFSPNGEVSVKGMDGRYELAVCANEGYYPLPWYLVSVEGTTNGDISLEQREDGILVTGDDLSNVLVTVKDEKDTRVTTFSTEKEQVLIDSEIVRDEEVPVIKIDSDQNGTFETVINSSYEITVAPASHGTLTANPTSAAQGDTVTLTATPNSGYRLASLTVTDEAGNPVSLTSTGNGTYTFTMPASAVTASAAFTAIPQQPEDPDTPEQPEQPAEPFTDVDETDWFYDEVVYVYANGLMDGVGGNRFAPDTATNRAMLATILYRLAGEPEVSGDLPFTDVETGTWYTDAVLWASQNGIVNGVAEGIFAPMNTLTREQLVTMLYRYAEAEGYDVSAAADLSGYPDAGKVLSYAQKAMSWAVAEGIVAGMDDGTLNPAGNATRAQIATILMRFCESVAQ